MVSSKLREKVQNLLKNDSVGKKPIICFTEMRRLLWGRQNVFSTFSSKCFYSWMWWRSQVTGCRAPRSVIWDRSRTMDHVTHLYRLKHILLNWKKLDLCQVRFFLEVHSERTGVNGHDLQEGKFCLEKHQHSGVCKATVLARHLLWLLMSPLR